MSKLSSMRRSAARINKSRAVRLWRERNMRRVMAEYHKKTKITANAPI